MSTYTQSGKITRVTLVGFGLMGSQIAQVFAQNGYQVSAYDIDKRKIDDGLNLIRKGKFGLERALESGRLDSKSAKKILDSIDTSASLEYALAGAELVLEAAIEDLKTKQDIMKKASALTSPDAILASNTSTLSISKISSELSTDSRRRVIGMHFFNPPQVMKLVEIVKIKETSDDTVERVKSIAQSLKKTPVVVLDYPGFVANRIGISVFAEASGLLSKGIASVKDIDLSMRLGYGYPMGPFELGDLVGLDARLRNMEALYSETKDERFKPPGLLKKLVAEGYTGDPEIKVGSKGGYYEYFGLKRPSEEN